MKFFKTLIFSFVLVFSNSLLSQQGKSYNESGALIRDFEFSYEEKEGVKSILSFYGGKSEYSTGYVFRSKKGLSKYFEIIIKESTYINKQISKPDFPASNIAYLFFKSLQKERDSYDEIRVVVGDEKQFKFSYTKEELFNVEEKIKFAEYVVKLIGANDFTELTKLISNKLVPFKVESLINSIKNVESMFTAVKKFIPYGFKIVNYKGTNLIHISGAIERIEKSNEFSLDLDYDLKSNIIYQIKYSFF